MNIKSAAFVTSSTELSQCPTDNRMEFAFIGRSNVGKSSLINMLTNQKGLAKTSQTPGKTQLINHFLINDNFYIVDLPGYGYAKTPQEIRKGFQSMIMSYTLERTEMACLFILIDIRHKPLAIDLDFIQQMGENGVPFALVFTKADKLTPGGAKTKAKEYMDVLSETWEELPPHFITSSEKHTGREELLTYIEEIITTATEA